MNTQGPVTSNRQAQLSNLAQSVRIRKDEHAGTHPLIRKKRIVGFHGGELYILLIL
jgi:hypothetical protein